MLRNCLPIYFVEDSSPNILQRSSFPLPIIQQFHYQTLLLREIFLMRKQLEQKFLSQEAYLSCLVRFIEINEGVVLYPYLCSSNAVTIGFGLMLSRSLGGTYASLAISAFKNIGKNLPSFQDLSLALNNKTPLLSKDEAYNLLLYVLKKNEEELKRYFPFFADLASNFKVVLHSLYYQNPIFVIGDIKRLLFEFFKSNYQDNSLIEKILWVIARESNRGAPYDGQKAGTSLWCGIQFRRYREMLLFSNDLIDKQHFFDMYCYLKKIH